MIDDAIDYTSHYQDTIDEAWRRFGVVVTHAEVIKAAMRRYLAERAMMN